MAFTFTNYQPSRPEEYANPIGNLISNILGGYAKGVNTQYAKPMAEAEIFHKTISPLAMLASSPFFSALNPGQQQQIAAYISQMLSGRVGPGGVSASTVGNNASGTSGPSEGYQGQEGQEGEEGGLIPSNIGQHFTGKFTETPHSPGVAFRGEKGETVYSPTGANIQKGIDVLTEAKGLKKLFDNYSSVAPKVAGAGGFKRELSQVASGISKTGLPFSQKIASSLGGSTLSDEAAKAEALKAQMAPALRALGFSNPEIDGLLRFYPGETEKNVKERLEKTWPVIERKIKAHNKTLREGYKVTEKNLNEINESEDNFPSNENGAKEPDMLLIAPDGSRGFVPSSKALELLKTGRFKEAS